MIRIRLLQGRAQEAYEYLAEPGKDQMSMFDPGSYLQLKAMVEYSLGNETESVAAMQEFERLHGEEMPVLLAQIHAWRGETEQAFSWIEQSFEPEKQLKKSELLEPFLYSLHEDPRWASVMARLPPNSGLD